MDDAKKTLELAAGIVAAYVGNHTIAIEEVPDLIRTTFAALNQPSLPQAPPPEIVHPKATPAQIRRSITPSALISFEDGQSYKTLKRHLAARGLTIETYKTKWGLPADYPMTAPDYSQARSQMAKAIGLGASTGRGGRGGRKKKTPR